MPPLPLRNTAVKKKQADSVIYRVRPSCSDCFRKSRIRFCRRFRFSGSYLAIAVL